MIDLIRAHIQDQGYYITEGKPTQEERMRYHKICSLSANVAYEAFRTEFDSPIGNWLTRAMTAAFGKVPVRERTMGGSVPIAPFVKILNAPAVIVPLANKDNNQHSPNENLRLGNYVEGIKAMHYILKTAID